MISCSISQWNYVRNFEILNRQYHWNPCKLQPKCSKMMSLSKPQKLQLKKKCLILHKTEIWNFEFGSSLHQTSNLIFRVWNKLEIWNFEFSSNLKFGTSLVSPNLKFTLKTWNLPPNNRPGLSILNQYMLDVDIQLSSLGTKFRVSNSKFRVWTSKFRVCTCKFRVWTVKFQVWRRNFKFEGEIWSLN